MFKERLKDLRKEKGVTQEELAVVLNLERSTIGKYESKKSTIQPSMDVIQNLAIFFDVSADYLLCLSDVKKPVVQTEYSKSQAESRKGDNNMTNNEPQGLSDSAKEMLKEAFDHALKHIAKHPWEDVDMRNPDPQYFAYWLGALKGSDYNPEELADVAVALQLIEKITGLSIPVLQGMRKEGVATLQQFERLTHIPELKLHCASEIRNSLLESGMFSSEEEVRKFEKFDIERALSLKEWVPYPEDKSKKGASAS